MIEGYMVGGRELAGRMKEMSAVVRRALDDEVKRQGYALQRQVQRNYLRGPRPQRLGVVTGRLLNSITLGGVDTRTRFEITEESSFAYVGTNVPYGAMWEFGFSRRVGAGARGGPRTGPQTLKAAQTYFDKHPPGTKWFAARPFLAPALEDRRAAIIKGFDDAIRRAAAKALRG